jgi:hypothetical protein
MNMEEYMGRFDCVNKKGIIADSVQAEVKKKYGKPINDKQGRNAGKIHLRALYRASNYLNIPLAGLQFMIRHNRFLLSRCTLDYKVL